MNWKDELKKKSWCILCGEKCEDEANHQNIIVVTVRDAIAYTHSLLKQQREIIAENDGLGCICGNVGYYVDADSYWGEPEQVQCEFCDTQRGSKFRILNAPEPIIEEKL